MRGSHLFLELGRASDGFAQRSWKVLLRHRHIIPLIGTRRVAADTIAGYIQGLLDGKQYRQTAYALDRASRKSALTRFLHEAAGEVTDEYRRSFAA